MTKRTSTRWTTKELNILKKYGPDMTTEELLTVLPDRTISSIISKKTSLGVTLSSSTKGRISSSLVYGVGINDLAGDANHVTKIVDSLGNIIWRCPFYRKWASILRRCYSKKETCKWPQYKDCTVSDEWHYFSSFKKWMEQQSWEGKHIDKDILVPGNKVYGKEFCLFVSQPLNNILHTNDHIRGECAKGVSIKPSTDKYQARISKNGKEYYLGVFDTIEEAAVAYECARREYIQEVANVLSLNDTSDVDATRAALLRHMELEFVV